MNTKMFSVLAEPNRLHIVELLYIKPLTVNEVAFKLHLNQPQTSKHLKVLTQAGLVQVHPHKNQRIYALRADPLQELDHWLQKYRVLWETRLDRLDAVLKREMKKRPNK